ncbi:F-box/RNI-like superfamily protein [Rhynchospora pubera]|uniref:F-box/RNI-like superfamily protein n=1 Tax=Rhynchospora pubera TaxID=906938 RepID=A0AAV8GUX0_9POAL|nr:F-box/RNI-like superfamily protein [Rhynchospora pubera]
MMRKVMKRFFSYIPKKQKQQKEEEGEDLISHLPEEILHIIISKLSLRDATVTTAVSKRWSLLFPTLPSLKIDAFSFKPLYPKIEWIDFNRFPYKPVCAKTKWINALFSVLKSRKTPVKKFEIAVEILNDDFYEVFHWLCGNGVEELVIKNCDFPRSIFLHTFRMSQFFEPYQIPSQVFSCNTIVKLEIVNCHVVLPSKFTGLQKLKSLVLSNVTLTDRHLRRMISGCKALEKLAILTNCFKFHNIVIRAPLLSELVISLHTLVGISLKFRRMPQLASVAVSFGFNSEFWERYGLPIEHMNTSGYIDSSPSQFEDVSEGNDETTNLVSFLNEFCGVKDLRLDFSNEYCMALAEEGIVLPTILSPEFYLVELKKLCLCWPSNCHTSDKIISYLLNISPHLMEIIIHVEQNCYPDAPELDFWDKQLPAECVKHHLTTATFHLDSYYMSEDCFRFPKFLLLNAKNLNSINILYTLRNMQYESEEAKKINKILTVNMASSDVGITIKPIIPRYNVSRC